MTHQQLVALEAFIEAKIDSAVENAFHRDGLHEAIRLSAIRTNLYAVFGVGERD